MQKEFPRGQLNPTILSTLLERDKYGYEIIEEIKQKTDIEVKQSSLYSSLKRMETQKYISSYWQDSEIGGKRHYYCLTAVGRDFLSKNPVNFSLFKNTTTEEDSVQKQETSSKGVSLEKALDDAKVSSIQEKSSQNNSLIKEITDVDEKIQQPQEKKEEISRFAQQDNIFNAIKAEADSSESVDTNKEKAAEADEKTDDFMQYDLFANIKKEASEEKDELVRIRSLHSKSASNPYQLKHLSEDELKNELEMIRRQKQGGLKTESVTPSVSNSQSTQSSQQNNVWLNRNSYINSQDKEPLKQDIKNEKEIVKEVYFAKENIEEPFVKDDGRIITERINVDDIPRQRSTPSSLNIESTNYSSFLNSRIANKENERQVANQDRIEAYQKKSEEHFKQTDAPEYDFSSSLAKLESKFEKHVANKNNPVPEEFEGQFSKVEKVENTYERVKSVNPVFNSYKGLESYFNSKGIGFHAYKKKDKSAQQYVDFSLIKLLRGSVFSLYSIILAIAFYCGINYPSTGKIVYIIIPVLALALTALYAISYRKSRNNTIIQVDNSVIGPVILPIISACAVLVIIAINLIIGFHHGNALYYFPLLIYPICLALHIALISPLNKFIKFCVLKYRELRDKK